MNSLLSEKPAILGGDPAIPGGPPEWPFPDIAINRVLQQAQQTGAWGRYHGPCAKQLQQKLAELHQTEQVILCSSGTVAVELALRGLGIGPDDEVILAAYDFEGNFKNIVTVGATPVMIDVDPQNFNLNLNLLEQAITDSTKGILVSHLHGGLVSMQRLTRIAHERGIPVIEDACQVPGAVIEGQIAGSWGDISILSFGGSKLLTAGRGGAILTRSPQIAQRIRLYSHRGNEAYPLTELQAGLLLPQLETLDTQNQIRQKHVDILLTQLGDDSGLISFRNQQLSSQSVSTPGYYKLGFLYQPSHFSGLTRDLFCQAMQAEGIAVYPGFRALHAIHSRRRFRQTTELPVATECDRNLVVLHHPVLLTGASHMAAIAGAVFRIAQHADRILSLSASDQL
ncbi:DegT/DnrJ/EryC1/StrS family aminotransferase [Gimesia algae]|uniref:L-glutamine:2-deoxy-scyllo-inosose aminotransferase n=1 Tax=Gimesia algae TaxID=2527971 RepID=A0A517VDY1_9PLAN|nr:aminotransferase class V-fold PLP-dependent enzyme [Gimesia algae]QDT91212.1 L-glutamine:2-deoxy-scyllo-inosose aminotransferase [Gimesia algae]